MSFVSLHLRFYANLFTYLHTEGNMMRVVPPHYDTCSCSMVAKNLYASYDPADAYTLMYGRSPFWQPLEFSNGFKNMRIHRRTQVLGPVSVRTPGQSQRVFLKLDSASTDTSKSAPGGATDRR